MLTSLTIMVRDKWQTPRASQVVLEVPVQVESLGWDDPLEEGMATHSSILTWRIPRTEEPGGLQSTGSRRARHDWGDLACTQSVEDEKTSVAGTSSYLSSIQQDAECCLTTTKERKSIFYVCLFLWCKCSHCDILQATDVFNNHLVKNKQTNKHLQI